MTKPNLPSLPDTPVEPVIEQYHGVSVRSDYRWLEDADDARVRAWTAAQNAYTRAWLDAISARSAIAQRLEELYSGSSTDYTMLSRRGGRIFAIKSEPPKPQPLLVALDTLDTLDAPLAEQVILDPNLLDASGETTIDFCVPNRDGSLIAVSLSQHGSEVGTLYLYETTTGRRLPDQIPQITKPTSGGDMIWNADSSGFFYTRYPRGDERPPEEHSFYQQIYYHQLGTPQEQDRYELGREFPRIAESFFQASGDGRLVLASVANGTSGEFAHWLRDDQGHWRQISDFADQVVQAAFGPDDTLYLLSQQGAPRGKVLRLPLRTPNLAQATTLIAEGQYSIQHITLAATRLYITEQLGGPSQVRMYGYDGSDLGVLPLEPVSAMGQVLVLDGDAVLVRNTSFLTPPAWYRYEPSEPQPRKTALAVRSAADFSDITVTRTTATSKDGTAIPLNIIHRKGIALDGSHPTILYAYGGLGVSIVPTFSVRRRAWLDLGGIYVVANLRGGGEFGAAWHQAGVRTQRQRVFDDFYACAEYLIAQGYTQPSRLAAEGRSNGGLLMGVALTQRPDLFRAVVAHVGIYDMLRVELHSNGASNVPEFGSVQNAEEFAALYAYSPLHRVVDGTAYPAVLLVTGEHDGRVDPANSRRMAARLQAASSSGRPVLLRTNASAGHGIGTALHEQINEDADVFAFLWEQLSEG